MFTDQIAAVVIVLGTIAPQPDPEHVKLVQQLDAKTFVEREKATEALMKIGEPARPALTYGQWFGTPEQRLRCRLIMPIAPMPDYPMLRHSHLPYPSIFNIPPSLDRELLIAAYLAESDRHQGDWYWWSHDGECFWCAECAFYCLLRDRWRAMQPLFPPPSVKRERAFFRLCRWPRPTTFSRSLRLEFGSGFRPSPECSWLATPN